jgi:hypothetical protein
MKVSFLALFLLDFAAAASAEDITLWEIGKPDHNTAKFALGPGDYKAYRHPGMFVVGRSDPKQDWPYVQPGVADRGWAPGGPQTFEIYFALAAAPHAQCTLELYLADTHSKGPPRLRVEVNQLSREYQLPCGGGDDSINGNPGKGRPYTVRMEVPARSLNDGLNHIAITTLRGSWQLWDAVRFITPVDTKLGPADDFVTAPPTSASARLLQKDDKTVQAVALRIFHGGKPGDADLRIGDWPPHKVHLATGMQTLETFVPPVEKVATLPIVLTSTGLTARAEVTLKPVRKWEVYILMHSHNDIGYTDIQPNIAKKQAHNVVRSLELIEKTKSYPPGARFKWNLEVMVPYEDFKAVATPDQMRQFEQAVREGNIGIDAMYGNLLTGVCRQEELLRQFSFGVALGRRCGVKVDSMMISDVPGLTWGVVPALVQNGVKYISDGPNASPTSMQGDRIGYVRELWEHKPFYWQSPSGREKVLYWGAQGGYSIGHGFKSITAALPFLLRRLERVNYPYDIVQMRWTKGDNGPPDEAVMDLVRDWNAKHAYPRLIIATTTEAFHAFEKRYGDKLPSYRGDMTPYWEDGTGSGAKETAINRRTADRLCQAETLWAMLNPGPYPAAEFAAAWKNITLWDEHTWGAHNSISRPELPFVKEQWKYKQKWALDADRESQDLSEQAVGFPSSGSARTSEPLPEGTIVLRGVTSDPGLPPNSFDVVNTCSWKRSGLTEGGTAMERNRVIDEEGHLVPYHRLPNGELIFLATDVPAFGEKRFRLVIGKSAPTGNASAQGNTLSTSMLSVRIDERTGAIAYLKRRGIDAELANGAINSFLYLPGGNVKDAKPNGPVKVSVKENGPLVASLLIESDAPGCKKLTREVRVVDGLDYVEIIDTIDKLPVREVEGVHFGFAFNVPNPQVHINSPGAVIQPEKDQLPGACKNWFEVERWADVSNDKYGVTWVTADAPLLELGGLTANLPRKQPDPNAYLKHIEPSSTFYSWVMNNHWHTNYRAYQEGEVTFRYFIRPHKAYDPVEAAKFGIETTEPLIAVPARGAKPLPSRLKVDGAGVLVSAMKPSDDGRAIIVRLYGASGKDATANLTWSDPKPKKTWLSDASEQPLKDAGDRIEVPAWDTVTLRAEMP